MSMLADYYRAELALRKTDAETHTRPRGNHDLIRRIFTR